jgi:hypothetical protein
VGNSHGDILTKIPLQISHEADTKDDLPICNEEKAKLL